MTDFKEGDKVRYTLRAGMIGSMTGRVVAVGTSLLGIRRDGNGEYDAVEKIRATLNKSPAEEMGLKVGDEVEVISGKVSRGLRGRVFLLQDDRSGSPRFRDEFGREHFITLCDVRKMPEGPREGVKWTDAPIGATHFSMDTQHAQKWHKLDENGDWHYASNDYSRNTRFIKYSKQEYARAHGMVAIPGITVNVNPLNNTLKEVKALEEDVRAKLTEIDTLQRQVSSLNIQKQGKLDDIAIGGYKVEGGKLVKDLSKVPSTEWKAGDTVVNRSDEDHHYYDLTIGAEYVLLNNAGQYVTIRDDMNDMRTRNASDYVLVRRK